MTKEKAELIFLSVNAETGETTERPLTADEIKVHKSMQAELAAQEAEQQAKTAARASALAKLAELGLTAEEIAAL
jgi:hypothetical protein